MCGRVVATSVIDYPEGHADIILPSVRTLNYDDVERLARDPCNAIENIEITRENCLACAEGRQSRKAQYNKR